MVKVGTATVSTPASWANGSVSPAGMVRTFVTRSGDAHGEFHPGDRREVFDHLHFAALQCRAVEQVRHVAILVRLAQQAHPAAAGQAGDFERGGGVMKSGRGRGVPAELLRATAHRGRFASLRSVTMASLVHAWRFSGFGLALARRVSFPGGDGLCEVLLGREFEVVALEPDGAGVADAVE